MSELLHNQKPGFRFSSFVHKGLKHSGFKVYSAVSSSENSTKEETDEATPVKEMSAPPEPTPEENRPEGKAKVNNTIICSVKLQNEHVKSDGAIETL